MKLIYNAIIFLMVEGRIIKTGDASLVEEINENGFGSYETQEQ